MLPTDTLAVVMDKALKAVTRYTLCDSCLGRLFGLLGYGLTNKERGFAIKALILMSCYSATGSSLNKSLITRLALSGFRPAIQLLEKEGITVKTEKCYICQGILQDLNRYIEMILPKVEEYEFDTFQIGCRIPYDIVKREEEVWSALKIDTAESIKHEITRELGKLLAKATGKEYSEKPDILVILDLNKNLVEIHPKPVCIYGRYLKLVRGLPQNPWLYPDSDRILYKTSIEELITIPMLKAFKGEKAKLHAAGREDVDVRTLGSGRPFIVEIKGPKKRRVDLRKLEDEINTAANGLIAIKGLEYTSRALIPKLKSLAEIARKTYRARVVFDGPISEDELKKIEHSFSNVVISQRTPTRILHRRPDKVRKKVVYRVKARCLGENEAEFIIECQGGLYVKELIHGDQRRTQPNFADILGKRVKTIELDVIDIEEPKDITALLRA